MTTLRLFAIEARHNAALLLVPVILLFAWYMLGTQLWEPYLWSSTNELLRKSVAPLAAPAIAGVAAWMAGRDRRRSISDLLATTPLPAARRHLTLLSATTIWALLSYLLVAGYMFTRTTPHATWGGPELWPVATAVAALLAHGAWGHAAGYLLSSRFTAPLAAIVAFSIQLYLSSTSTSIFAGNMYGDSVVVQTSTWLNHLALSNDAGRVAIWQSLLYLSLAVAGLVTLWLLLRRDLLRGLLLGGAVIPVVVAVILLWAGSPRWDWSDERLTDGWGNTISIEPYIEPEPVCRGDEVSICVHPQYQPWLDRAVVDAEYLVAPLQGLPGITSPVECRNTGFGTGRNDDTRVVIDDCVDQLVADESALGQYGRIENDAQQAISVWLLTRIGGHTMCGISVDPGMGFPSAAACDAGERFAALPESRQRAWLETHYADLRAGTLTLADLP